MKSLFNLAVLLSCFFSTIAYANAPHIGIIIKVSGEAYVLRDVDQKIELSRRDNIYEGDRIVTQDNSTLQIRFIDKAMLALRENSEIIIEQYHTKQDQQEERVFMELLSGGFRTITGNFGKASEEGYEVKTPAASIGIRGTDYEVALNSEGTLSLGVWSGGISVKNDSGSIDLGADTRFSFATVKKNSAPKGSLTPPETLNQKIEAKSEPIEKSDEEPAADQAQPNKSEPASAVTPNNLPEQTDEIQTLTQPQAITADPISNTTQPEANYIQEQLDDTINEQTGNDRLTGEQITQIANNPNVGLIFFSENDREPIYAPVLQSNTQAQVQNFSTVTNAAQIISSEPWPSTTFDSGAYKEEFITIQFGNSISEIYLIANNPDDFISEMQLKLDEDLGDGTIKVYQDDSGALVFIAEDPAITDSFTLDTANAVSFAKEIGLDESTTANTEITNFNLTFDITVQANGSSTLYTITLDKEHTNHDDLIADIVDDLPSDANIIIQSTDAGIEIIAMTTDEDSSIAITSIVGENDAANRLEVALGGMTQGVTSETSNSGQSIHFGYMLENEDGTITFITYPDESTVVLDGKYIEPEYILNGGNIDNLHRETNVGGFENINWGYWNNTQEDPATVDASASSENGAGIEEQPDKYYFIDATPAQTGQLVGQKSFSTTGEFLGESNTGEITAVSGQMQVNFSNSNLTGNLDIQVGSYENWQMNYEGNVQGANVQMQNVWGQANFEDGSTSHASGTMGGIFVDPGSIYVGGFQIQTVNDSSNYVDGVYLMQEAPIETDQSN